MTERPQMVERTCLCGCGRRFRVMEGSAIEYASVYCPRGEVAPRPGQPEPAQSAKGTASAAQVARALGIALSTVYLWASTGKIPAEREGRGYVFNLDAVRQRAREMPEFE